MARKPLKANRMDSCKTQRLGAPNPANYEVGSPESRAAARAMLQRSAIITSVVIGTGLPRPRELTPIVRAPDTLERYVAQDGSIVEVICREWETGKFTAFIDQTWPDGSVYQGNCRVNALADVEGLRRA